jgi:putative acetyltransferase
MLIRREQPADAERVAEVHRLAFPEPTESALAVALREGGHAIDALSLVAEIDGEVVGHVVCSRGSIDGRPAAGLGPIGVVPHLQSDGVGSALMHAVIGAADAMGEPFIALLGNPDYYGRFGFVAAAEVGVSSPDPAWGVFFQVRTLSGFRDAGGGAFRYASPFDHLG